MIKRILLIFVCIFSTILCFADRITVGNFRYEITPGSSEASLEQYNSNKYSGDVVIPSSFTYEGKEYQVTKIGSYAFNYCPKLTSVKIPNGVKEIGDGAFSSNSKVKTITIPNSVEKIGNGVFTGCNILENIVLDEGNKHFVFKDNMLLSYDGKTLYHVLAITSGNLVVPEGVCEIKDEAISRCWSCSSISLPNSLKTIGKEAFSNSGFERISIPENVSYIGEAVFGIWPHSRLNVTLQGNNSYYKLEDGMLLTKDGTLLLYVSNRKNVVEIPKSVIRIGESAIARLQELKELVVPDNVQSIGSNAVEYCQQLESVTLGSAIKEIEPYTFMGCGNITSITVRATNPPATPSYGSFSAQQLKATLVVPKGCVDAYKNSKYAWSKFAKIVDGDAAPAGKPETLENVVVDGITYNTYADTQTAELRNGYECKDDVIIPEAIEINGVKYAVTKINDYSFGYTDVTSVSLPNTLETLGDEVFIGCEKLKKINLPKSVKVMGINPFAECKLTDFAFDVHNPYYKYENYQLMTSDRKKLVAIVGAISENGKIDLVLDDAIEEIGDYAASHATLGVSTIKLPRSLKSIGVAAFERCDDINTITLPASLAAIWSNPFTGCEKLSDYIVEEGNKNFKAKDGILTSYDGKKIIAFSVTKDITIPSTAEIIADGASFRNYNIETLVIPDNIKTIGHFAFQGCHNLKTVYFGKNIESLGQIFMNGVEKLEEIYCYAVTPYHLAGLNYDYKEEYYFFDYNYQKLYNTVKLHVPKGSLEAYKSAKVWRLFDNIDEFEATDIDNVVNSSDNAPTAIYDANGMKRQSLAKGLNIIRMANGSVKKVWK